MQITRFAKIYGIHCLPISFHDYQVLNVKLHKKDTSLQPSGCSALGSWQVRRNEGSDAV